MWRGYKECVDHNAKSGNAPNSCEFFDNMEEIFGYQKNPDAFWTMSFGLPAKLRKSNQNSSREKNDISPRKNKDILSAGNSGESSCKNNQTKKRKLPVDESVARENAECLN